MWFLKQAFMTDEPISALPIYAQLQRESPPSARVCEMLASSHGLLKKWGQVERLSLLALAIDPSFYHAHYVLGVAAKQVNNFPKVLLLAGALRSEKHDTRGPASDLMRELLQYWR